MLNLFADSCRLHCMSTSRTECA